MSKQKQAQRRQNGFTIVELLVAISITALLSVVLVAFMVQAMSQIAVSSARSKMASNAQIALTRINDDIRTASSISLCNLVLDSNAPSSLSGAASNVPCEDDPSNTNYQTFWRLTSNQLILNKTPVTEAGDSIYDNAETQSGIRDVIVYYVKGDALFRRVIPAPYTTPVANVEQPVSCPQIAVGGCADDTKIIDGLKVDEPGGPFKLKYYNAIGNEITTGPSGNNYDGYFGTKSIDVDITLSTIQNGQTIAMSNSSKMNLRNTGSMPTNYEPQLPPDFGMPNPSMMAGSGGVIAGQFTDISPAVIYIKGKLTIDRFSNIGTPAGHGGSPAVPANLYIANTACGTGISYPAICGIGSPPLDIVSYPVDIVGPVCATGQTTAISSAPGLVYPCTAPVKDLPVFDKQAFVTSMKAGSASSATEGTCPNFVANKIYVGDMRISCGSTEIKGNMYIKGDFSVSGFYGLKVADSAGKKRPVIVVNGKIKFDRFNAISPNNQGTLPYFISMFTTDTACMRSDSCTSISGSSLLSTMDNHTGESDAAISVAATNARTTIFYSYFGETYIGGLTDVGAIAGQRIRISGLTTIDLSMSL